jgi:hypothetical protein
MLRLLSFLLLLVVIASSASAQMISNYSFEAWHSVNGWYEDPDYWTTNNDSTHNLVQKDSVNVGNIGKYCAKVTSNGRLSFLGPVTLWGWPIFNAKFFIATGDTVKMTFQNISNGKVTNSGSAFFTANHNNNGIWHLESAIQFGHSGTDTLQWEIFGGKDSTTVAYFDYMSLERESVDDISARVQAMLYPNPMVQSTLFRFRNPEHTSYSWLLMDATGRTVTERSDITGDEIKIERGSLPAGFYFWQLISQRDFGRASGKLTIQ